MDVRYKVMSTYKPGKGKEGDRIWFPKLTGSTPVNLKDIASVLAKRTSASEADVYLVMMGLVDLMPELLAQGRTIKLDRFGTFRLHARVKTDTDPEKITTHYIKEIRLGFKPDKEIKNALKHIRVVKV